MNREYDKTKVVQKEYERGDGVRVMLTYPSLVPSGARVLSHVVRWPNGHTQENENEHTDWRTARAAAAECVITLRKNGFRVVEPPRNPRPANLQIPVSGLAQKVAECRRRLIEQDAMAQAPAMPKPSERQKPLPGHEADQGIVEFMRVAQLAPKIDEETSRRILLD